MNIGPFSFPVAPLILLVSVAIAVLVARFAGRGTPHAERVVVNSVIVGLVVSRLSFVAHYLPAYSRLGNYSRIYFAGNESAPQRLAIAPHKEHHLR